MKNIKWKHYINYILIGAVTLIFTILAFAGALERSLQVNLEQIAIAMMLAVSEEYTEPKRPRPSVCRTPAPLTLSISWI